MAMTLYATNFYNNDGSLLLWSGSLEKTLTITITLTGASISGGDQFAGEWAYTGSGTFQGLATSSGASTPTYAVGDSFTTAQSTLNLYTVVSGSTDRTLNIKYKNNSLYSGTIAGAITKTLKCNNKAMYGDVEVIIS